MENNIYEHIDEVIKVCEFSHIEEPKPDKINYNIWDFVLWLWGLEALFFNGTVRGVARQAIFG